MNICMCVCVRVYVCAVIVSMWAAFKALENVRADVTTTSLLRSLDYKRFI